MLVLLSYSQQVDISIVHNFIKKIHLETAVLVKLKTRTGKYYFVTNWFSFDVNRTAFAFVNIFLYLLETFTKTKSK